jgi:hydrogenase expression/formation protein HypD
MSLRDETLKRYADELSGLKLGKEVKIMEVCGTHTVQFFHTGVKDIFPARLSLVDGPGCPVCVTGNDFLDRAIEIGRQYKAILCTFGDMLRVPSSYSSLQQEKAAGLQVQIVYSPLDALDLARKNPDQQVIFLSVGFETTIPTEAVTLKMAKAGNVHNFSILSANKLTPPAVAALLDSPEVDIRGFILPGHVSTITGVKGWRFVAEKYHRPCVIAGFTARDLVIGTLALLRLIEQGKVDIVNGYRSVVFEAGNEKAQQAMDEVFEICDADWRGIGKIPLSGMCPRPGYADFDAEKKFPVSPPPAKEPAGCRCGDVLRGLISPPDCPLFGQTCTPSRPVGACMVSSEGSCAAFYKYREV